MVGNVPTIILISLVKWNPDTNISFDAHYSVIDNTTLSKYNNNVDTLCTAIKQSKSDIILNSGTYPEKMHKQFLIKALNYVSNAKFNEYVHQNTNTWNESSDIDLYKFLRDCKRQYLNMVKDFCKP